MKYLNQDCTIHIISKYGKADFDNYVNLTKLLEDSIIIVTLQHEASEVDNCLEDDVNILESTNDILTSNSKRKQIDKGKIIALHNARWSAAKIADEMRCSIATVYKVIKMKSNLDTSSK